MGKDITLEQLLPKRWGFDAAFFCMALNLG